MKVHNRKNKIDKLLKRQGMTQTDSKKIPNNIWKNDYKVNL